MEYTFSFYDNDKCGVEEASINMSISDVQCWQEVTDFYLRYLRAVGFVLTKEMLAEYLDEKGGEYAEVVDD